jgi:hypothetical protein
MKREFSFPWRFERSRYSDHYLVSQVTEARVQEDILELLKSYNVDAVAIDAGGRRQRGRMMGAAKKAGIDLAGISNVKTWYSIPAGFADLEATLAPMGRALYIEVKAPMWIDANRKTIRFEGKASNAQLDFLCEKARRGALVMIAWSVQDVESYLSSELRVNWRSLQ